MAAPPPILAGTKIDGSIAWQKQVRDLYLGEGRPSCAHDDVGRAMVCAIPKDLAKRIILKYEWLGTMAQTTHHYGIFFGPAEPACCGGVTCFGTAAATAGLYVHRPFDLERGEVRVLARGACVHWAPRNTNSRLVASSCHLLRADDPRARLVLAYADEDAGEIGTIYQACNWTYIGPTKTNTQYVSPDGRVYARRIVSIRGHEWGCSHAEAKQRLLALGWHPQEGRPKHRYAFCLDPRDTVLLRRLELLRVPYPKRSPAALTA